MEVINNFPSAHNESANMPQVTILCSICGTSFPPSSTGTNVCLKCITTTTDITDGITKQAILNFCRTCKRYLRPPWTHCELESKELLALCLRRIRGLSKVKLLDASFIWTEPHSRRIKIKLTVQKEALNNVNIQQTFPIEFHVFNQQCEDCKKEFTPHTWGALVQVRQKAEHKKTFFYLEQLILKYNAHDRVLKIKEMHEGIDFFYKDKTHALRLVDFLQTMFSIRTKHSKQLISQDLTNNTCNYKYVVSVDLPKVCKDDLVVLKPKLAASLGGCSTVLVCTKVATLIQFIDPVNMKTIEMNGMQYFQHEDDMTFIPAKGNLSKFTIFDIEPLPALNNGNQFSNKLKLARAEIARESDWQQFEVKTFMGDVLKEGNTVEGYDLTSLNFSGYADDSSILKSLPDVILMRKVYDQSKSMKKRIFKLKHLDKENADTKAMHKGGEKEAKDYEEFLNDLEANPEMRSHVNLYRDEKNIKRKQEGEMQDEDAPEGTKKKKQHKKKLRVRRKSKKNAKAGDKKDKEEEEEEEVVEGEEDKNNVTEKEAEEEDENMVKIDELLADLTLEENVKVEEDNGDAIDDFIRRLEKVKIEGKQ